MTSVGTAIATVDVFVDNPGPIRVGHIAVPVDVHVECGSGCEPTRGETTLSLDVADHDDCPGGLDLPVYLRDRRDAPVGTLTCCTDCQPTTEQGA